MKLTDYEVQQDGDKRQCPVCESWVSKYGIRNHFWRHHDPSFVQPIIPGTAKTPEAEAARRAKISATAKERGSIGGYRHGAGRTKKYYVLDSFGTKACLQSSHEMAVAEWLNARNIKWKREGCFFYNDRRYFPDFYLPESDTYLDVKNEYLIKVDEDKINSVRQQNPGLKLIVFTLKNIEQSIPT